MGMRAIPVVLLFATVLAGCASTAIQLASIALDGVAYVATGKGSTDLALSAVAGEDCRLANAMKNKVICSDPAIQKEAEIAAVDGPRLPLSVAAFVPSLNAGKIPAAGRVEPAVAGENLHRVFMHEAT
jgi:hypothetical protein